MFRHQVALNWKKYQKLTIGILLIFSRMLGEISFGWAPLDFIGVFKLALIAIGGLAGLAFLKTLWQLGTALGSSARSLQQFSNTAAITGAPGSWLHN